MPHSLRKLPFRFHKAGGTAAVALGSALFGRRLYLENVAHVNPETLRFRNEGALDVWNYWNNAAWSLVAGAAVSAVTFLAVSRREETMSRPRQNFYARSVGAAAVLAANTMSETEVGQHVLKATELGSALMLVSQPHFSDFAAGALCGVVGALAFKTRESEPAQEPIAAPLDESVSRL